MVLKKVNNREIVKQELVLKGLEFLCFSRHLVIPIEQSRGTETTGTKKEQKQISGIKATKLVRLKLWQFFVVKKVNLEEA